MYFRSQHRCGPFPDIPHLPALPCPPLPPPTINASGEPGWEGHHGETQESDWALLWGALKTEAQPPGLEAPGICSPTFLPQGLRHRPQPPGSQMMALCRPQWAQQPQELRAWEGCGDSGQILHPPPRPTPVLKQKNGPWSLDSGMWSIS